MTEKVEWEVVDTPASDTRQTIRQLMKRLLGPWWRWKVIGAVAVAGVMLALFAALTGLVMLVMSVVAIVLISVGRLMRWMRDCHTAHSLREQQLVVRK